VIVHGAIAIEEATLKQLLDEVGKPNFIIVPNGYHRCCCGVWKSRFPEAKIVCPSGCRKTVLEKISVDMDGSELATQLNIDVRAYGVDGFGRTGPEGPWEYFWEFRQADGTWAMVCTDMLFNLRPSGSAFDLIGYAFGSFGGPGGARPVISRLGRYFFIKNKPKVRDFFGITLGSRTDLGPLIVGHGDVVPQASTAEAFRGIAASLK